MVSSDEARGQYFMEFLRYDRIEYEKKAVDLHAFDVNPLLEWKKWLDQAIREDCLEANAMVLSTVGYQNQPHSRTVLCKGVYEEEPIFFTYLDSTKGSELSVNPRCSALFFWPKLQRQVIFSATAHKLPREAVEQYFKQRPRESQLATLASYQSRPLPNREILEKKFQKLKEQYEGQEVPCPTDWTGYSLKPTRVEFWQGGPHRLHFRVAYTQGQSGWEKGWLYP